MATDETVYHNIQIGDIVIDTTTGENLGAIISFTSLKFETEQGSFNRANTDGSLKIINRENVVMKRGLFEDTENEFIQMTKEMNEIFDNLYIDINTDNYIYKVFPLILRNLNPSGDYIKEMIISASYPDEAKILASDETNIGMYSHYWTDTRFLVCQVIGSTYLAPRVISISRNII
jgi:hypothetical protein